MKLTILGAGAGACVPGTSTENLYPPAFLVEWDDQKILFDCSEGVRFRLEKAGHLLETIHHLAISHSHADHFAPLPFLLGIFLKGQWGGEKARNEALNIYCPDAIAKDFPVLWGIHWKKMDYHSFPKLQFHSMSKKEDPIVIGNALLFSNSAYHSYGNLDALCYRFETPSGVFVYSGDTGDCEGVRIACKDADFFVCESSARLTDSSMATQYGHLNARQAGEIAKSSGVKHLILFHYSGLDSDDALIDAVKESGFAGRLTVGKDSQTFEV
ncbi:MBL fold metallo-hydrolase [Candidatus Uhrbacteria bacterium]|nr:MBL fold metallo-hydrolase [Candidatus Uhrbacteria bacterium]